MAYQTLDAFNGTGIIGVLQANSQNVSFNLFPSMIIISIWAIIALGSYYSNTRRYGRGDIWASIVVGGFVSSLIAGILYIIPNFIPLRVLVITIILTIVSFIILSWINSMERE